ncbi:hypothetical protein N665_0013s0023 [Sinapis alba]|nr:hypothetical protein N665_0013s0023 [Sinapis alba]
MDLHGVQTVQAMGKDKKKVQFRLRDCSGDEVACCLWGKFADQVETNFEDWNNQMVILLIRFAKIGFYRGEVQITNAFDASIVDINPTFQEAVEFKEKMLANDLPLAVIEKKEERQIIQKKIEDWNDIEMRSISEILVATETGSCKVICSIESIDTDWGWFYFGCNRHNRRVTKLAGNGSGKISQVKKPLFNCDICRANISNVSPKYKLHLYVKDDSESCQVMMLDSVAQAIIGNTATELWDGSYDEVEDPNILPQPIENIVGQSFCFGISITNDNVSNGSVTFKVSEVWCGNKIQKIESQTEPSSCFDTNSSTLSGGEVILVDQNKESSSEGFSTPLLKRKEEDADLLDMNSTSKMKCTKMVKLEKTKTD